MAILGLLKSGPCTGYQLKKRLAQTRAASGWSPTILYPALKRLQRQGAVEMILSEDEVGRRKNVYPGSPPAARSCRELLETRRGRGRQDTDSPPPGLLPVPQPETRIRVLERRRVFLDGRSSKLKDALRSTKERIDNYTCRS